MKRKAEKNKRNTPEDAAMVAGSVNGATLNGRGECTLWFDMCIVTVICNGYLSFDQSYVLMDIFYAMCHGKKCWLCINWKQDFGITISTVIKIVWNLAKIRCPKMNDDHVFFFHIPGTYLRMYHKSILYDEIKFLSWKNKQLMANTWWTRDVKWCITHLYIILQVTWKAVAKTATSFPPRTPNSWKVGVTKTCQSSNRSCPMIPDRMLRPSVPIIPRIRVPQCDRRVLIISITFRGTALRRWDCWVSYLIWKWL